MTQNEHGKRVVKASEARQQLPQLLNAVYRGDGRVIVERSGIPVAAIVSPQDLATLEQADRNRAELGRVLDGMRDAFKDVPPEELERETERAVAQARAELRAERAQEAPSPTE